MLLEISERTQAIVKNRRSQRGVRVSVAEYFCEMLCAACAAGSDDWNPNRVGHDSRQVAIEARGGSVTIHRRQQDLACAARLRFPRPLHRITIAR